ncbi:hypothetical protein JAAARDRAFT_30462 [Jaapia argillacea MUCL 33604]|uniref:NmrA-like domain-containing protein n=1 Tax=Jaapia argillacea MUCL 33604 TaxID=933084 RepID=A0A067QIW5_9AGAM|nr:hypothetical protein JAAARDRAFT_30462 [Jaapia argillacea MUCL 33604]
MSTSSSQIGRFAGPSRVIAVAGASGRVGKHVVEGLLSAGFTVIALLRQPSPDLIASFTSSAPSSSKLIPAVINYTSPYALTTLSEKFKEHRVDTVISTLFELDDSLHQVEDVLLDASLASGCVKRFSPSNYAMPVPNTKNIRGCEFKRRIMPKLEKADISWTHFACGIFTNYLASGAPPKANGDLPQAHLNPLNFIINPSAGTAHIPGTGDAPCVFTVVQDVARGVAEACKLKKPWQLNTGWIVGDKMSYNEAVRVLEEVTGRKFTVTHTPLSTFLSRIKPTDTALNAFYVEAMAAFGSGDCDFDDVLGGELKSEGIEWKATSVREFVEEWWGVR